MSNLPAAQEKPLPREAQADEVQRAGLSLHGRIRRGIWRQSQLMTLSYT